MYFFRCADYFIQQRWVRINSHYPDREAVTFFNERSIFHKICLVLLLAAGLWVRLIDLKDPPLDIHPTRQLHSALMARGMYYDRVEQGPEWMVKMAIIQGKKEAVIEPPIMEWVTSRLYEVSGGENVWIARILSSSFWVLAGLAFFSLAKSMTNVDGGLVALAVYLFLPYSMQASRTFQPDPLMVSLIVTSWWSFNRWQEKRNWQWTVIAGLVAGLAIFVKSVAVFFLAIPYLVVVLQEPVRKVLQNRQNWLFGILAVIPAGLYTIYGIYIEGFLSQQFSFRLFPSLLISPAHYSMWFKQVTETLGLPGLLFSLLGLFLFRKRSHLRFVLGCWVGYIVYGTVFAYHIATHDYYQLPFIPMAVLSIAPIGSVGIKTWLENASGKFARVFLGVTLFLCAAAGFWNDRLILLDNEYRTEANFWQQMGDRVRDYSVVALTEDYGYRITYFGWCTLYNWPSSGDFTVRDMAGRVKDPVKILEKTLEGRHYFLVTWFEDFNRQQGVKDYLYSHYPYEQGDRYILFDLSQPIQ